MQRMPGGVRDTPPATCARRRKAENAIIEAFSREGYMEVDTPTIEYASLFVGRPGGVDETQLIKTFDARGRVLALRPEFTIPIARMVAGGMAGAQPPLRLCYVGNAFEQPDGRSGKTLEFRQAGVELMGMEGPEGDAEVITLAARALESAGLAAFQIDIGQVGYFKGLMEEAGLDAALIERLRAYTEEKNMLDIEMLLRSTAMPGAVRERILALPGLYGGVEVLDAARRITASRACHAALDDLSRVIDLLAARGLTERISIDLGMVHAIHYYSGLIFRGLNERVGHPLLSGGRYDHLLASFGADMPATGFALGVERLLDALEAQEGGAQ